MNLFFIFLIVAAFANLHRKVYRELAEDLIAKVLQNREEKFETMVGVDESDEVDEEGVEDWGFNILELFPTRWSSKSCYPTRPPRKSKGSTGCRNARDFGAKASREAAALSAWAYKPTFTRTVAGWKILELIDTKKGIWNKLPMGHNTLVVVAEQGDSCAVAFRGTVTPANLGALNNWGSNFNFPPTKLCRFSKDESVVHQGFLKAVRYLVEKDNLGSYFKKGGKCYGKGLLITGHSLGGAMASIFTELILEGSRYNGGMEPKNPGSVVTVTFGQPRLWYRCPPALLQNKNYFRYYNCGAVGCDTVAAGDVGAMSFCNKGTELSPKKAAREDADDKKPSVGTSALPQNIVKIHDILLYKSNIERKIKKPRCSKQTSAV